MSVFGDYARYYNLLYAGKEYAEECHFILQRIEQCSEMPATLLDLGCGTAKHAVYFADKGISVFGVDLSDTMLEMAAENIQRLPTLVRDRLEWQQGDARTVRLNRQFDAITSLFHVMSYQTTEEDALAVLHTVKAHLHTGGCFFCDFWHTPGVLLDPPVYRERVMENDDIHVLRTATPRIREAEHIVEVHYAVALTDKKNGRVSHLQECHTMRHWTVDELARLGEKAGFILAGQGGWMHSAPASSTDWNAWIALKL